MRSIIPSIDLCNGKAVKRVRGERGSGIVVGDPVKIAEKLYEKGFRRLHVVDLDAAEGVGSNEDIIKTIASMGFDWIQVGGGIRSTSKALRMLRYGASAVVLSTIFFKDRAKFTGVVEEAGSDKVILALDYRSDGHVYLSGWRERGPRLEGVFDEVNQYKILGVLLTYIDSEGTLGGIDRNVTKYINRIHGLKEYAGGVSSMDDVAFLTKAGVDYVIVGMAFYRGLLGGYINE